MVGPAISSETYVTEKEWHGVDGYLASLENQHQNKTKAKFNRTVTKGESGSKSPSGSSLDSNTKPVSARSASDCSSVWMDTSGNNLRYDGYLPSISIKIKLTISTLVFSGGRGNPDTCFRRWYFMDYINHQGQVYDRAGRRVINANKTRQNEAYYKTEHNYYAVGSVVAKPSYAATTHDTKFKNNERRFTVTKRLAF